MSELREEIILILDTSRYTDCFGELEVEKAADAILNLINTEVGGLVERARDHAAEAERKHRPDPNCSSTAASDAVEAYESVIRTALPASNSGEGE